MDGGRRITYRELSRLVDRLALHLALRGVRGGARAVFQFPNTAELVILETQGRPVCPDDEIRIVEDDGREVPSGELGELRCRGPCTIRGYYRAAEHNRTAFTADGFYKTGDLVRRHPSGNLVVEGRKKDTSRRERRPAAPASRG